MTLLDKLNLCCKIDCGKNTIVVSYKIYKALEDDGFVKDGKLTEKYLEGVSNLTKEKIRKILEGVDNEN